MNGNAPGDEGWFAGLEPGDLEGAVARIRDGDADRPRDWPAVAVDAGFAADADGYYDSLHEATTRAASEAVRERELADDQQLIHAVRAMDDCRRTANELAERVAEWAGTRHDDAGSGVAYARQLAGESHDGDGDQDQAVDGDPHTPGGVDPDDAPDGIAGGADDRLVSLARRTAALGDEADELERYVETVTPDVAPNLAAMAGPVLAARLVALAGGLDELAKMPSSTVQVLGAEDALFAHLRGAAPSPKHGVIFTHEYVRGTRRDERGSAARALAGKLTIAARVDHYSGERRPSLDAELDDRIRRIRGRGTDDPERDDDAGGGDAT